MENRYYIPELEEFHVGFEYEMIPSAGFSIIDFSNPDKKYEVIWATEYVKGIYGVSDVDFFWGTSAINPAIINEKIRVKYLDQEDIESLGWEKIREDTFEMKLPNYRGMINVLAHLVLRTTLLICVGDSETPYSDWRTLFTGTVKNKSELKKVMKMLGI